MAAKQDLAKTKHDIFDHVDNKLDDFRGDFVLLARKADKKNCSLVEILKKRKVITLKDKKNIFGMEPFAR
ncbi:hypothetical protein CO172_02750 [Candidatus Uhrbacteria bacterium CG_4_9_14_3_um_filter_36_7]|uniref:Uncharacterized protein n=1 Tax=Candidatus Uhrbacteria bacterium CG_4_9_14_3_um_filter_36_7 TaxID=1975033 RepID=A0A2M7XH26_9BACT|nr:MAG: hypothetical protein CO172_02750 [Candidatus Uhrbacteria bacterium CG_4_9_14_3_um_filter_36_7]